MTNLWKPYNPNPSGKAVGDCAIRALCKATGKTWEHIFAALCAHGFMRCDMPSANHVWGAYLRSQGFRRHPVDDCTVEDFCREHPTGTYILAIDGHVVCAVDGYFYDSWNSGQEIPVYYWTRGDAP